MNPSEEMFDSEADLVLEEATSGLSVVDRARLDLHLAREATLATDLVRCEAAAATIHCAFLESQGLEALPAEVRRRIVRNAAGFRGARDAAHASMGARSRFRDVVLFGGWLSAAALLLILVWNPRTAEQTAESRRDELLRVAGSIHLQFKALEAPFAAVTGDVVWNDDRQDGVLHFRGLNGNEPLKSQFQLWIVDADRQGHPVDGGVFDVPRGGGDVFVRVHAKLRVEAPNAFVLTEEQPGGVVVSDGPHLLVAAR